MVRPGPPMGMTVMAAPTTTWMRLTRRLGCDGNPLRRRSDLIEGLLLPAAIVVFLALCPIVAAVAGMWIHADNTAARHDELSWHRVSAVLLNAAPGPLMSDNGANSWEVWTLARWTLDGRQRHGDVPVPANTRAGSTVPIWLDRAGSVRMPALTAAQVKDRVVVVTMIALAGVALFLAGSALLARRVLDRRRLAGWEAAWLLVGPNWSHQG